mgnify:CR=1 FL=1
MLTVILVEGELSTRDELADLISAAPEMELLTSCSTVEEAARQIIRHYPQVLLLGKHTTMLDGFRLLGMLNEESVPQVVFVTPPDHDALKGLEDKGFDYLLDPVSPQHLSALATRVAKNLDHAGNPLASTTPLNRIPCTCGHRIKLIDPVTVEHIHSDLSGVHVFTAGGNYFTELTLKVLERQLGLFRCHKQSLVNLEHVCELTFLECGQAEIRTTSGHQVAVSRRYLRCLKNVFQL